MYINGLFEVRSTENSPLMYIIGNLRLISYLNHITTINIVWNSSCCVLYLDLYTLIFSRWVATESKQICICIHHSIQVWNPLFTHTGWVDSKYCSSCYLIYGHYMVNIVHHTYQLRCQIVVRIYTDTKKKRAFLKSAMFSKRVIIIR